MDICDTVQYFVFCIKIKVHDKTGQKLLWFFIIHFPDYELNISAGYSLEYISNIFKVKIQVKIVLHENDKSRFKNVQV